MQIRQLYTNCLAQGAYYISNGGEAAIIDPLRDTRTYLDLLAENRDQLKYIFETHFHADFVSGHVDLARETGATIVFGPEAQTGYESVIARDEQEFNIGKLTIRVLHTPGHTLESSCFLLLDEDKKPVSIFTGDTLFIGDVGRPDLAVSTGTTQSELAGMLYDSLRSKILPLPGDVIVYPGHGAGSACGKNMSKETSDTLEGQKQKNYALSDITKEEFIRQLTDGIMPPPYYFAKNAAMNKNGYQRHDDVVLRGVTPLEVTAFREIMERDNAVVLDVRKPADFATAHVPGSLFVGLDGQFAPWVGTIINDIHAPLLLVVPEGREEEAVLRLTRVGYDNCIGFLKGGVESWKGAGEPVASVESVSAEEFAGRYLDGIPTIDVRKPGEFESGHLKNAVSKPLDLIHNWYDTIDAHKPYVVHCAGGYRSMIAISLLKSKGINALTDIHGGFGAISKIDALQPEIISEQLHA